MRNLRTLWSRLGRPEAIGWFNFGFVVVLQTSGSLLSSLVDYDARLLEFLGLRLTSFAVLGGVLAIGRLVLNRVAGEKPRPEITLVTFVVAIAAGTATFDQLLVLGGFEDEHLFLRRLIVALPGVMTGLTLISVLVTSALEHSRNNQRLIAKVRELETVRGNAAQTISDHKENLIRTVREQVDWQVGGFSQGMAADIEQVRSVIDDVVRPLSYSLSRGKTGYRTTIVPEEFPRVSWRGVMTQSLLTSPFHPLAFSLVLGAISASFLIFTFGFRGLLATILAIITTATLMVIGSLLWRLLPDNGFLTLRAFLYMGVITPLVFLTSWFISMLTGLQILDPLRLTAWGVIVTIASWAVTLSFAVFHFLATTETLLRDTVADLRREVAAVNTSLRQLNKSISRILHGPIQQAITVILMRLEGNPALSKSPEFAAEAQRSIAEAMSLLDRTTTVTADPMAVVEKLQELWGDVIEISLSVSEPTLQALSEAEDTTYAVSEVVREACQNAIKHGKATSIDVSLNLSLLTQTVDIVVENTGTPATEGNSPGLGSQLFDDLSLTWSRSPTATGTRVTLTLPLLTG
jgi:two-component sensor histidine kinase